MRKWVGISLVLSTILVYWLWPKASIEKPIVVSAQVMESNNTMSVSYITTKKDDMHLMEVAVNGKGFYPPSRQIARELATQNGYQLREATIKLSDEELAYLMPTDSGRTFLAELSFKNYSPVESDFIMLLEEEAAEGTIEQGRLRYTFTAPEPLAVFTVGHYNSVATISWSRDGSEVKLPLAMEKGDTLDLHFSEPYKMGSEDELLLEIQSTDGKSYTRHLKETVQLPDGYLKQMVNEHR